MTDIYIDGSYVHKDRAVGFGVRIEHGEGHELFGGYFVNPDSDGSLHEYFAFVEGADFARRLGLKPSDCVFLTDCNLLVYGAQHARGVAGSSMRENLLKQLIKIRKYYRSDVFNNALMYLTARFIWLKGHGHSVGNRRVDHLAAMGRKKLSGKSATSIPYEQWLFSGYSKHNGDDTVHYYPAFTASYIERDGVIFMQSNEPLRMIA